MRRRKSNQVMLHEGLELLKSAANDRKGLFGLGDPIFKAGDIFKLTHEFPIEGLFIGDLVTVLNPNDRGTVVFMGLNGQKISLVLDYALLYMSPT